MKDSMHTFLHRAPQVIGVAYVAFLMMFSLDVFESGRTLTQIVIGLLMHNIPALLLLMILVISRKYELIAGITFMLAGLLYILLLAMNPTFEWYMISWSVIIAGPAFIIGGLFVYNWWNKTRDKDSILT